ncbi:hypothetical protein [Wolbachia endosymbiont of Aedes albopictus]|uniref:hypothetical protein n=1 Tax=Wolbachia endosymbiont of Aedes albopictus TaxID=167957 RepID=UPI000BBC5361|nr:hypothetical protein [Wolbachia endosymbiont of Aedes albopictus]UVW83538.1 hypothetical protein NHG98_04115 [Wolbachia endosymbiont of Aedes albopictus]
MWEKIKKFFKWIADHTGISWIARKISSGWKWLFGGKANATQQNRSQQEKSSGNERQEPAQTQSKGTTTPKTLDDEVNSQPGASVNNSTSNSGSSSFVEIGFGEFPEENKEDNSGSPKTSGRGDDIDGLLSNFGKKSDEQSKIDGVEGKKPATSLSASDVQAAGNDKTR